MVAKLTACRAARGGVKRRNDRGRTRRQAAGASAGGPASTTAGRDEGDDMTTAQQVKALEARHVLQTYKRQPVVFVRGDGRRLFDVDGREYLDFLSGIGVVVLGHATRGWPRSIADQAQTLIHTSNLYYHPLQGQLAAQLAALSGWSGRSSATAAPRPWKRASSSRGATGSRRA